MSDKNFKVKNKVVISGLTGGAGPVVADSSNVLDSVSNLPTQYGGTGTTTSPSSGQILYSESGTTYSPTTLSSLITTGFPSNSTSSNITLSSNNKYFINTSAERTLTLPSSPDLGDEIHLFDANGNSATNNITVNSNSGKINGSVQDLTIDVNGAALSLIYTGSDYGWVIR